MDACQLDSKIFLEQFLSIRSFCGIYDQRRSISEVRLDPLTGASDALSTSNLKNRTIIHDHSLTVRVTDSFSPTIPNVSQNKRSLE
jgi:hypothetical protein